MTGSYLKQPLIRHNWIISSLVITNIYHTSIKKVCVTSSDQIKQKQLKSVKNRVKFSPLTPTVAIWGHLHSILCQTRLSCHL